MQDETKSLVVYFSCTGTTKRVAEIIADGVGADLYESIPVYPYTSADLNCLYRLSNLVGRGP